MPEKWTGALVGKMHNYRITQEMLADKLGVRKPYVSMILNGKRKPPNIRKRMEDALNELIAEEKGE